MAKLKPTYFEFEHPKKIELEEWLVVEDRLKEVTESLESVHKKMGRSRKIRRVKEPTSVRPEYCFAVVTYMRCFAHGRNRRLSIDKIPGLTRTNAETHDGIRDLRNRFFAHAVDDHEGATVYLFAEPGQKRISGLTSLHIVLSSDSLQGVRNFMNLLAKVRLFVSLQINRVGDEIAQTYFGGGSTWKERSAVPLTARKKARKKPSESAKE